MLGSQLNEDITMDIVIVLYLFLVFIFNIILTVILLNVVIKMVPSTWSDRLHISAAHRMSCQALSVYIAVTLLSRRCYVCHSFACNHLQYQSIYNAISRMSPVSNFNVVKGLS